MPPTSPVRPLVTYVLRQYPVLSQTFVRNEVQALRATGVEVRVLALWASDTAHIDSDWAGPVTVLDVEGPRRIAGHLLWWLAHHPRRLLGFGVAVAQVRAGRRAALLQLLGAGRSLVGAGVVACHTHFAWHGLPSAIFLSRLLACPSSATVHAHDIYVTDDRLARRLARVDRLVTVCRFNVDYLRRTGLYDRPVDVVPCGVAVPAEVLPLTRAPREVVTVGRLVEKKGMLTLLEAFAVVLQRVPDATLRILGDGPQHDDLDENARRLGLTGSVEVLGARGHEEVLRDIGRARVFALACQVDGEGDSDALPVVLREAMARARAVVSTAVAGIPEVVDDETGWLVAPRDVPALAEALVEALTDDDLAQARGDAGRRRTLASGTLDATARGMRAVLGIAA